MRPQSGTSGRAACLTDARFRSHQALPQVAGRFGSPVKAGRFTGKLVVLAESEGGPGFVWQLLAAHVRAPTIRAVTPVFDGLRGAPANHAPPNQRPGAVSRPGAIPEFQFPA